MSTMPASSLGMSQRQASSPMWRPGTAGLRVIDVSTPVRPGRGRLCRHAGGACGVAVSGGFAYVADDSGGLRVVRRQHAVQRRSRSASSTRRTSPMESRLRATTRTSRTGTAGLQVFDVQTPSGPFEVSVRRHDGQRVRRRGRRWLRLRRRCRCAGLRIFDVSNPWPPVEVAYSSLAGRPAGLRRRRDGGYAYLAEVNADERRASPSDRREQPTAPVEVGPSTRSESLLTEAHGRRADGHVFVAAGPFGSVTSSTTAGPLFTDGFESGDTSAWSAMVP